MDRDGTLVGSSARAAGGGVTEDLVLASASGGDSLRGATHARALRCIRVHTVGAMMENCIHVCPPTTGALLTAQVY
jgi:hypothetical protein